MTTRQIYLDDKLDALVTSAAKLDGVVPSVWIRRTIEEHFGLRNRVVLREHKRGARKR